MERGATAQYLPTGGWNHVPCFVTDLEIYILWVGRACAPPQPTPQIKLGLVGIKLFTMYHIGLNVKYYGMKVKLPCYLEY